IVALVGLGHVSLVALLGVVGLALDGLLDRLGREQLLEGGAAGLEALLGVFAGFGGDRLRTLGERGKALQPGVGKLLAVFGEVLICLGHFILPLVETPI